MLRTMFLITCTAVLSGCGLGSDGVVQREGQPDYVEAYDQGRMDAAIAEAEGTLDTFVEALRADNPDHSGFALKKGFAYGESGKEFIWIDTVALDGDGFTGVINNAPVNDIGVSEGEKVRVARSEVADWLYMDGESLRGGYTVVALAYGSKEEAQYEKQMGIDWSRYEFLQIDSSEK